MTSQTISEQTITALLHGRKWLFITLLTMILSVTLCIVGLPFLMIEAFWELFLPLSSIIVFCIVGCLPYYFYGRQIELVQQTKSVDDLLSAWEKKYIISVKWKHFKRKLNKQKKPQLSEIQRLQNINRIQYSQINTFQFWVILLVALFGWIVIYSLYSTATISTLWNIHYFYKIIIVDVFLLINLYGLIITFLDLRKLKNSLKKLKQAVSIDVEKIADFCQKEATCNYHVGLLILFNAVYLLCGIALTLLWIAVFDL